MNKDALVDSRAVCRAATQVHTGSWEGLKVKSYTNQAKNAPVKGPTQKIQWWVQSPYITAGPKDLAAAH